VVIERVRIYCINVGSLMICNEDMPGLRMLRPVPEALRTIIYHRRYFLSVATEQSRVGLVGKSRCSTDGSLSPNPKKAGARRTYEATLLWLLPHPEDSTPGLTS
jgi:hypothetical protein